jgi:hypothetical protein
MDNSDSTSPLWNSMVSILSLLSYVLEGDDPNGEDLKFTNSSQSTKSPYSDDLVDMAKRVVHSGRTDVSKILKDVFGDYESQLPNPQALSYKQPILPIGTSLIQSLLMEMCGRCCLEPLTMISTRLKHPDEISRI